MISRKEFEEYCIKNGLRYKYDDEWNNYSNQNWNRNIFCCLCASGYIETAKWLYSLGGIDIHINNDEAFILSCESGYLEIAKWLVSLGGVDVHFNNNEAFRLSYLNGYLEIVKWLYSLGGVDIHAENDDAFRRSCVFGYKEIAKWLVSLGGIDIHAENNRVFRLVCECRRKKMVKWFLFKLGFLNNPIIEQYPICKEIIYDKMIYNIYNRKKNLFNGYIQNGYKSLFSDKVSLNCFKECLLMV